MLWVRIALSEGFAFEMLILLAVGVWVLTRKNVGHKLWLILGLVSLAARAVASLAVAWNIYNQTTRGISPWGCIDILTWLPFVLYTVWVRHDLAKTMCLSEKADVLRKEDELNRQQLDMCAEYMGNDLVSRAVRLSESVAAQRG